MRKTARSAFRVGLRVAAAVAAAFVIVGLGAPANPSGENPDAARAATSADDNVLTPPVAPPSDFEIANRDLGEASIVAQQIIDSFPDAVGFTFFNEQQTLILGFTGEATPDVLERLGSSPVESRVIENVGFSSTEYERAASFLIATALKSWPEDVPFPMIGTRPDLGVGAIGVTQTGDGDQRAAEAAAALIASFQVEPPFTIEVEDRVLGVGETASYGRQGGEWIVAPAGEPYNG